MKCKLLTVLTLATSIFCSTTAFAASIDNPTHFDGNYSNGELVNGNVISEELHDMETFGIGPSMQRISDNGTFYFDITTTIKSTEFSISSSDKKVEVTTFTMIKDPTGADVTSKYPNHKYSIKLQQKVAGIWLTVGNSNTFIVDPTSFNVSHFDAILGSTYRLVITNNDYLPAGTTLYGNGYIKDYVHPSN